MTPVSPPKPTRTPEEIAREAWPAASPALLRDMIARTVHRLHSAAGPSRHAPAEVQESYSQYRTQLRAELEMFRVRLRAIERPPG